MTTEQQNLLQAARFELQNHALVYALVVMNERDASNALEKLLTVAKNFTRVVDSIDPALWEPCRIYIEPIKDK